MLISSTSHAVSNITSSAALSSLEQILELANKDTLVIFDVDHVLIMPTSEYSLNRYPYRKRLWQEMKKRLPKTKIKLLHSIVTATSKWRLIDPQINNVLAALEKRQIPTIALTAHHTGKFGIITKMENLRIKELNDLGIDFNKLAPSRLKNTLFANKFPGNFGIPMLTKGVILTAEQNKAAILEYILQARQYTPEKIIFIDDKLKNVVLLQEFCDKLKIKFHGFHYTAVSEMIFPAINNALEPLRLQILEQEHRWLSYKELAAWQTQ